MPRFGPSFPLPWILVTAIAIVATSCKDSVGPGPVFESTVDIGARAVTVEVGSSLVLDVEATDSTGALVGASELTWTSSGDVVVVDSTGTIWGRGPGSAVVTARLGGARGARDSVAVEVAAPATVAGSQVVTGRAHSCALDGAGAAWCWGDDGVGQLGNGDLPNEPGPWASPVRVAGGHRFLSLSAGLDHTCGVTDEGRAWCWGGNAAGQLGDGSTDVRAEPVAVPTGERFVWIAAGGEHTCALAESGRAFCWGRGVRGQLGTGAEHDAPSPQAVATELRFESLAAGEWHTCGLDDAGAAHCWGQWRYYSSSYIPDSTVPVRIMAESTFRQLDAALLTTCGVEGGGGVRCLGAFYEHIPPVPDDLPPMASVATGSGYVCGISVEGPAYCWGANNHGQLGDGTTRGTTIADAGPYRSRAVRVLGEHRFVQLAPAWGNRGRNGHTCGLTESGEVYCWGLGADGQIGAGILDFAPTAVAAAAPPVFESVSATRDHSCALTAEGEAWCWGNGRYGQLGNGATPVFEAAPVRVETSLRFSQLVTAVGYTCGLAVEGTAWCWGHNRTGQLADGTLTDRAVPTAVVGGLTFDEIAAGRSGSPGVCGRSGTDVYCWLPSRWSDPVPGRPTRAGGDVDYVSIVAGCGLTAAGKAYCWDDPTPGMPVPGDIAFTQLAVGGTHTCGIADTGRAYCWGRGFDGALGTGTFPERLAEPTEVADGYTFARIVAGYYHTCGLTTDERLLCWGANGDGQIGDGTRYARPLPVDVTPPGPPVRDMSAGEIHSCAVQVDGALSCWGGRGRGSRGLGLLGDGLVQWRTVPTPVGPPLSP